MHLKWKEKWFPNILMRDGVSVYAALVAVLCSFSSSVMLKRDFGRNMSTVYKNVTRINDPSWSYGFHQVRYSRCHTLLRVVVLTFFLWIINCQGRIRFGDWDHKSVLNEELVRETFLSVYSRASSITLQMLKSPIMPRTWCKGNCKSGTVHAVLEISFSVASS